MTQSNEQFVAVTERESEAVMVGIKLALDIVHSSLGVTIARKKITTKAALAVKSDISDTLGVMIVKLVQRKH